MDSDQEMLQFASEQISARLGRLAFEISDSAKSMDADSVHDLRVAIRRYRQSLIVFDSLLPNPETKKIHKRLKQIMDVAGQIRDRDIALEFLKKAGVKKDDPLHARINKDRKLAERALADRVKRWYRGNLSAKWRSALQLSES